MVRAFMAAAFLFCGVTFVLAAPATPEDFSIRLEQVPGTHDAIAVGSMAIDGVQGWSWGICFDPEEVRITDCLGSHQVGDDQYSTTCRGIYYPDDILDGQTCAVDG